MNVCSIWPFAQISDDFYYLDICQCARYFVAALFKKLALITIREMWGLQSRSRSRKSRSRFRSRFLWQSLGLVSKFKSGFGLGLGGYGLDSITLAHIPFVVNHAFNATSTERLQQRPLLFAVNHTYCTFFCESCTWHHLHMLVTAPLCCDWKA